MSTADRASNEEEVIAAKHDILNRNVITWYCIYKDITRSDNTLAVVSSHCNCTNILTVDTLVTVVQVKWRIRCHRARHASLNPVKSGVGRTNFGRIIGSVPATKYAVTINLQNACQRQDDKRESELQQRSRLKSAVDHVTLVIEQQTAPCTSYD
ncbi:hypothetical protein LSAT2_006054 [Lamellibrachia satsuma]|nr:hypothetical protein LSAT2_006054 [Lamellibrachia satsuma]